jgi:hypothetical protein
VDTESEVQEVESPGLAARMITRRNLIKGGAIVGGTVWVAPAIESFTNRAFGQSVARTCCQCFSSTGRVVFAGQDDFSTSLCQSTCHGVVGGAGGHWVLFTSSIAADGFSSADDLQPNPGCTFTATATYLGGDQTCPGSLPTGVSCFDGSTPA